MVLRSVRLDAPRERHRRSGCGAERGRLLLHMGAGFPQQVLQVAARVPMDMGSLNLRDQPITGATKDGSGSLRSRGDTLAL